MEIKTQQLLHFAKRATINNKCFAHKCYKYLVRETYFLDQKEQTSEVKDLRDASAFVVHYLYLAEKEHYDFNNTINFFTQSAIEIGNDNPNEFMSKVAIILLDMVGKKDLIKKIKTLELDPQVYEYALKGKILYE